jgi:hypothetical protein
MTRNHIRTQILENLRQGARLAAADKEVRVEKRARTVTLYG